MMAAGRRSTDKAFDDLAGARILVVEARFYDDIADALLDGAKAALAAARSAWDVVTVQGSLEIPSAMAIGLDAAAARGRPYDGAVALGCVIRGDTIHFEIVSMQSARGLMDLSVARGFPIGNGIITVDNEAQAWKRARRSELDKGGDAVRAALTVLRLKRQWASAR